MQRKIQRQQIVFAKPSSISQCLKCSVCFQPFHIPTRLFCGHTFCLQCIQIWNKSHPNCPVCREKIDKSNMGKDLLAFNIINELPVFCIHKDCSWKGTLENLRMHVNFQCLYDQIAREEDSQQKAKSMPGRAAVIVDEEVEEKINQNTSRGNLIARAMMKDSKLLGKNLDVARKIIRAESHNQMGKTINVEKRVNSTKKPIIKEGNKIQEKIEEKPTGNYDFLMDLYDSE